MDIRQLRYFVGIAQHGSLSKAATHLNVAQPALSHHIRNMEEELGVPLLHRGAQGVAPTAAGNRLIAHALTILAEFSELQKNVGGNDVPSGEVRLGLPATVGEVLCLPIILESRRLYPCVRVRIVEAMSGYILDWLQRGQLDLAIVYGTAQPKSLAFHHVLSEELCLFGARGNNAPHFTACPSIGLAEASRLDLILPGPTHGLRELIDAVARAQGVTIRPAVEIDSYANIKRLVQSGVGCGILPRISVNNELQEGVFDACALVPKLERSIYLCYSNGGPLALSVREIGALLWSILRRMVRDGIWIARLSGEEARPAFAWRQ